jgi:hypothetical protein
MSAYIDPAALGQVLVAALVGGVGLVAVFALGLRGLAAAQDDGRPGGLVVAGGSFLVVIAALALGIGLVLAK